MSRGSTWNIWDFHLHTPCSILNNQFGDPDSEQTWGSFLTAVETVAKEKGVAAIGVTDYFSIEGYKKLIQYQSEGRLSGIFLFPNIEFRVDRIIYRGKNGTDPRRLNVHVLFDPGIGIEQIEEHFLHDLDFIYEEEPFGSSNKRKLKLANLRNFGQELQKQHPAFQNQDALFVGCKTAIVPISTIKDVLDNKRFRGRHLLVLAEENTEVMDWEGQDHAVRKHLIQMSHAVFSANPKSREFLLGQHHSSLDEYLAEFKSAKPCLWGCDSHGLAERFLEPDKQRYCWIKGEVSWDGLKQVLYEPVSRVRIQPDKPEPQKSIYTIDSVRIAKTQINRSIGVAEVNIDLNPNLVTIIGGRGSGKTAILDLIATCFREGNALKTIDNSFYARLYVKQNSEPIPVQIEFQSGDKFPSDECDRKLVGKDDIVFGDADILYLTQSHIDEYTANPTKLYTHIIDLVFDRRLDQRRAYDELGETAQRLQTELESTSLKIQQLRSEVSGKIPDAEKERTRTAGDKRDLEQRLQQHQAKQAGSTEESEELAKRSNSLKTLREKAVSLRTRLENLLIDLGKFHVKYTEDAKTINELQVSLESDVHLAELPITIDGITGIVGIINGNKDLLVEQESGCNTLIGEVEGQLGALQGISRTIAEHRQNIDALTKQIEGIDSRIAELQKKEEQINVLDDQRNKTFAHQMRKIAEQRLYLQSVITQFEADQDDEMLNGLTFAAHIGGIPKEQYLSSIVGKVDGRTHASNAVEAAVSPLVDALIQKMNEYDSSGDTGDELPFLPTVQELRTQAGALIRKRNVTESDFFNTVLSPFFQIGLHIEFNGKPLESLSMGERAVVLLKILLGLDDRPLLIDQPEEHLDNRYIYDELTPAFRKAKTNRQIIIATHNANLVVNTDAEQIIIADHSEGTLSYRSGTIENPEVREIVKTILEGGDQAFKKREEKYGYRF